MKQYCQIKKKYLGHILLFRMGDFYEVFFDDAHKVAKTLNIALTHRGKLRDKAIPMAGIPHHAATNYIDRLTKAGLRATICEQVQDPKEARGIVERAVTRLVSPAVPFDVGQSEGKEHYYTVASFYQKGGVLP